MLEKLEKYDTPFEADGEMILTDGSGEYVIAEKVAEREQFLLNLLQDAEVQFINLYRSVAPAASYETASSNAEPVYIKGNNFADTDPIVKRIREAIQKLGKV